MNLHRDSLLGGILLLPAYVLAIFSFIGIAYVHRQRLSLIGLIGFGLVIIGNALFIPWVFLDIARLSGTIPDADWYFVERNGSTGVIAVVGGASFVLGYLVVGLSLLRARLFSPLPSILLILAAIQPFIFPLIRVGKMLPRLAGLALILFAIELWKVASNSSEKKS